MRLKVVGKHPHALGSECVIFGYIASGGHAFIPIRPDMREGASGEIAAFGRWDAKPMRPTLDAQTAPALVGAEAGGDHCRTAGRLVVLSHSWSGTLQINNLDRKYTVDLFSQETRLLLLDLTAEILLDVSRLAAFGDGAIHMPEMSRAAILRLIVEDRAWFRFLTPDADFAAGFLRRALGWRLPRTDAFKLQIMSRLLPEMAARPAPQPAPHPGLSDEMRLLAAAVEGLALRAPAEV